MYKIDFIQHLLWLYILHFLCVTSIMKIIQKLIVVFFNISAVLFLDCYYASVEHNFSNNCGGISLCIYV